MRIRRIIPIQLALSLAIITALSAGCASSPSTAVPGSATAPPSDSTFTPPTSTYPADISGRVTIPEFLHMKNLSDRRAGANQVFWVVDISIKNKSYERVVTSGYKDWHITAGGEVYYLEEGLIQLLHLRDKTNLDDINITVGQTGQTTFIFSIPDTLQVSDAKLRYQGQEPYSYGKLTGGDQVAVYDWDLKKVVAGEAKPTQIQVFNNWKFQLNKTRWEGSTLSINLTITNLVERRDFFYPYLAVIDSTKKVIKPLEPERDLYKEYYPTESWTGNLSFMMSPYSGETKLGLYGTSTGIITEGKLFTPLFDLGSPQ